MAPSVTVEKVSEGYQDYILTAGFICTFTNYLEFVNSSNRRQVVEKHVSVSDGIVAKLIIYPTGVSEEYDGCISIYAGARWNKSKSIVIKIESAILDSCAKRILHNSSENFERVPANALVGDPQVLHSDLCYNRQYKILSAGCIMILVNISVNIEMMIHPDMLDRFQAEYSRMQATLMSSFQDPAFGDTVLLIRNRKYYVEQDVLIRGNPMFVEFFADQTKEDGCYEIMHQNPEVMEHILLDCYLNGDEDRCDAKRSYRSPRIKKHLKNCK